MILASVQGAHTSSDSEMALAASSGAAPQDNTAEGQTDLPALYSASHAVSSLAGFSSSMHALDRIRDIPVQVACQQGAFCKCLAVFDCSRACCGIIVFYTGCAFPGTVTPTTLWHSAVHCRSKSICES